MEFKEYILPAGLYISPEDLPYGRYLLSLVTDYVNVNFENLHCSWHLRQDREQNLFIHINKPSILRLDKPVSVRRLPNDNSPEM